MNAPTPVLPDHGAAVMPPPMALALCASFGSVDRWQEEFVALGIRHAPGSGRVLLSFLPREGALANQHAADHAQAPARGVPLLALDLHDHASQLPLGAQARAHAETFIANIDWASVYARYQQAVHAVGDALGAAPADLGGALLIDVRRAGVFEQASTVLPGAVWRNPALVATWADALPKDRDIVVYCVYGHEVGRSTAMQLHARGVKARFLQGGIDGWQKAARPLAPKRNLP